MWTYTFINQYGVTFTYTTGEGGNPSAESDLAFIQYCIGRKSILVDMQPVKVV